MARFNHWLVKRFLPRAISRVCAETLVPRSDSRADTVNCFYVYTVSAEGRPRHSLRRIEGSVVKANEFDGRRFSDEEVSRGYSRTKRMDISTRLAFCAVLTLAAGIATAHPGLVSSSPKAGELLDAAPKTIRLSFNEPVEPSFTTVKVTAPSGKDLAVQPVQAEGSDSRSVSSPLTAATPGTYRAQWSALGRDGHRMKGEFTFTVK